MLNLLLPFQRFFIPGLIILLLWSIYRTIVKKDRAVGLVLYLGLVIIVDAFLDTGIYIPGMEYGSIKYSEVCAFFLILNNPKVSKRVGINQWIITLLLVYFMLFFYSALRGFTLENGINNFRRIIIPQIIALIISYKGFEKKEDYHRFLLYFMSLLIIIGLFTFWDVFFDRWILHSDSLLTKTYSSGRRNNRFGSFFLNPNYMGAFAVLVFPVVFLRALLEKILWKKVYCWTGVLALFFALVKTQSRGPMLGFAVSICFFIFIPMKSYPFFKKIIYVMIFISVIYLFMPGFIDTATERFSTMEVETSEDRRSRRTIWNYTLRLIAEKPVFGIGLGEIQYIKHMMRDADFGREMGQRTLDNAHNSYLQIAVHAGIIAVLLFMLCNLMLIIKGLSLYREIPENYLSLYSAGFIAGIIGFLVSLVPGIHMFTMSVAPAYWVIFGLLFSICNLKSKVIETLKYSY